MKAGLFALGVFVLGFPGVATAGIVFNFTEGTELAALATSDPTLHANVVNGFQEASTVFSGNFLDNVTLNVEINFRPFSSGNTLGGAVNVTDGASYASVRGALIGDALSADDATAVANLQAGPLDFLSNARDGSTVRSNGAGAWSSTLDVSRANLKALGLLAANDTGSDGDIAFNSNFSNWDFDRSDGISGFDFVGVAIHEIGHLMGFTSGVDIVDSFTGFGGNSGTDLNGGAAGIGELDPFRIFNVLDLFRYSADSLAEAGQPATGAVLDLRTGGSSYYSIDGGATSGALVSTGAANGDGRQASHWKDNLGLGIMDPTFAPNEFGDVTSLDFQAFDVMGWDFSPVPEPTTLPLIMGFGSVAAGRRRRRESGC